MNKEEKLLYDAAIAEVRGEESSGQKRQLEQDPYAWRTALRQVLDEIDSQKEFKKDALQTTKELQGEDSRNFILGKEEFIQWQEKVGVFRKYISARLTHVDRICKETPRPGANQITGVEFTEVETLKAYAAAIDDATDDDAEADAIEALLDYIEAL